MLLPVSGLDPNWWIQLKTAYGWKTVECHYKRKEMLESLKDLRAKYPNRVYRVQPYNNQA